MDTQRIDTEKIDTDKNETPVNDPERNADIPSETKKSSVYAGLGWLDRLLVLWILLAIIIGILLGNFVDSVGPALQRGKFVDVSVPIGKSNGIQTNTSSLTSPAVGLLAMMYPILCKVQYETLHLIFAHREIWVQLGFSILVNWIVAPLLMVGQILFLTRVYTDWCLAWTSLGISPRRTWTEKRSHLCRTCSLHRNGMSFSPTSELI